MLFEWLEPIQSHTWAIVFAVLYLLLKGYVAFWIFKPLASRYLIITRNETLRLVNVLSLLALAACFFFTWAAANWRIALVVLGGAIAGGLVLRLLFLLWELDRYRESMRLPDTRKAWRHVRGRSPVGIFL